MVVAYPTKDNTSNKDQFSVYHIPKTKAMFKQKWERLGNQAFGGVVERHIIGSSLNGVGTYSFSTNDLSIQG